MSKKDIKFDRGIMSKVKFLQNVSLLGHLAFHNAKQKHI